MTLGDLISFKENNIHHVFTVITLRWPLCVLFVSLFSHLLLPIFYARLSLSLFSSPCPFRRTHAGWSAWSVVLFNMHSPFLLLYYCPTGGGGPFLSPDNGRRRDREHGGHVPFATPCYLSIRPPFSPTIRFSIAP